MADIAEKVDKAVVGITNRRSFGTGFFFSMVKKILKEPAGIIISKEGHILTNHHVIDGAKSCLLSCPMGKQLKQNW